MHLLKQLCLFKLFFQLFSCNWCFVGLVCIYFCRFLFFNSHFFSQNCKTTTKNELWDKKLKKVFLDFYSLVKKTTELRDVKSEFTYWMEKVRIMSLYSHFIFMHLADAFIQSDLHCIQVIHFLQYVCSWELNPQPFAPLAQCSTTEPQEHLCSYTYTLYNYILYNAILFIQYLAILT